ncbi:MAG: hypothetical protein E7473_01080 [Ruminococcaceae bacterium]|nr:hypothetical protein [Oscillospiraceae bacterium]
MIKEEIILILSDLAKAAVKEGKYGFIHKTASINFKGKKGRLVWDYILWNELTFEDLETGLKYSLGQSASDKKTEQMFNQLVELYGEE